MIGSVTEYQQQMAALGKRATPAVPQPDAAQIAWARQILGRGYQADQRDRLDAQRVLEAAGSDGRPFDAAAAGDTAPPGTREIAAAMLAREQADTAGAAKSFGDRGAAEGPSRPLQPGTPGPGDFDRGYLDAGHAAPSPQSTSPRPSALPRQQPGAATPVALPGAPVQVQRVNLPQSAAAGYVPAAISSSLTMGSPSER